MGALLKIVQCFVVLNNDNKKYYEKLLLFNVIYLRTYFGNK